MNDMEALRRALNEFERKNLSANLNEIVHMATEMMANQNFIEEYVKLGLFVIDNPRDNSKREVSPNLAQSLILNDIKHNDISIFTVGRQIGTTTILGYYTLTEVNMSASHRVLYVGMNKDCCTQFIENIIVMVMASFMNGHSGIRWNPRRKDDAKLPIVETISLPSLHQKNVTWLENFDSILIDGFSFLSSSQYDAVMDKLAPVSETFFGCSPKPRRTGSKKIVFIGTDFPFDTKTGYPWDRLVYAPNRLIGSIRKTWIPAYHVANQSILDETKRYLGVEYKDEMEPYPQMHRTTKYPVPT